MRRFLNMYIEKIRLIIAVYFCHVGNQIEHFAGITPFVVVPADHFHECRTQLNTGFFVENGRWDRQ